MGGIETVVEEETGGVGGDVGAVVGREYEDLIVRFRVLDLSLIHI